MKKPQIVQDIEKLWGNDFEIHPAPTHPSLLGGLMAFKNNYPKYAVDDTDQLIGLNLATTGLDDKKWEKIAKLLDKSGVKLQALDLNENKLTDFSLSPSLADLAYLDIDDNPIESIPEEIFKQGKDAILRFLKELQAQGARELFEVKMLIVGEGETGKTTLWKLLQNPNHPVPDPKQKLTIGIQIKEGWTFRHLDRPDDEFYVNLWDFGGQDIQYMTHQFFLTRRSFYVLLADGRREAANFPYWLQIIELLGCEQSSTDPLPLLVVLNEKGNPIAKLPYDSETVKKDYQKLGVIRREVDFANKKDGRIEALTKTIKDVLCHQIDHLPLTIPTFWDNVRQELYKLRRKKNHINFEKFIEICEENGIKDEQQQEDLSQLLHDLGMILHFREDPSLADFIVLNPQWAVNAVYEIMKHEEVKTKKQGRFDKGLLKKVWKKNGYSLAEQGKLLNLMLKDNLEVCFKATEDRKTIYIAPQLLPETKPKDLIWEETPETLWYIYHYPFMPKGIIGRLIVRLNEFIESSGDQKIVWENGTIIQKDACRAQVQFVDDKKQGRQIIKIEVQGKFLEDRKNVLRDVRNELDFIHKRSFPALKVFQKIPCNCSECKQLVDPFEHDFSRLKANRIKNGDNAKAQCGRSFENIPVLNLLDGVFKMENKVEGGTRHFFPFELGLREDLERLEKSVISIKGDTEDILFGQKVMVDYLESLLLYSGQNQQEMRGILTRIDEAKNSGEDLSRINSFLEERMKEFFDQVSSSNEILQKWEEANSKLPDAVDIKWKLKFKIPFLFGTLEKDLSYSANAVLNSIRDDWNAFLKGEKTFKQLFIE